MKIFFDIIRSEVFLTVFCGVMVFIISQFIIERIIKPQDEFKKLKGKIVCELLLYNQYIFNPYCINKDKLFDDYWNASRELKNAAIQFSSHLECYPYICKRKKYKVIFKNLSKLSLNIIVKNSQRNIIEDNEKLYKEICKKLKIDNN